MQYISEEPAAGDRSAKDTGFRAIFSVSDLNSTVRKTLESTIGAIWVEGEVTNLAKPNSGHWYFSLRDDKANIRCAMFRNRNSKLGFPINDGTRVLAYGRVSLYEPRGDFQLIIETLEPAGEGLLQLEFERLKKKLHAQGLFEPELKQELPRWPGQIGVITSPHGAAVRDVITVLKRRCPTIPVIIYPTLVQGEQAALQICSALKAAERRAECDVLIVARGGGSIEDLWSFNDERVARAIHELRIPIVSGVGHETDFTITDLVADLRAATPSAAAELVSPNADEMSGALRGYQRRLTETVNRGLTARRTLVSYLTKGLVSPQQTIENWHQRLDDLSQRAPLAMENRLHRSRADFMTVKTRLNAASPERVMSQLEAALINHRRLLKNYMQQRVSMSERRLERVATKLEAFNPQATLERGYAIITGEDGKIVHEAGNLKPGDRISARVSQGEFQAEVTED